MWARIFVPFATQELTGRSKIERQTIASSLLILFWLLLLVVPVLHAWYIV